MEREAVAEWWRRGGLPVPEGARFAISGDDPVAGARHHIGEAAACAAALAGCWAARIHALRDGAPQSVSVDVAHAAASLLGFLFQHCDGIDLTRLNASVTAIYATADQRWIHLHGGFPHLADATLALLGAAATAESIAAAVATWSAEALEDALARKRLCAAVVRSAAEWAQHPQGKALAGLDALQITKIGDAPPRRRGRGERPLAGVRVADFTRVLAGPTCGRTLAAHGADVLRIASPQLPSIEPFVVETGRGKRSAFANLDNDADRARVLDLLTGADVVTQGYRLGSLARRGLGAAALAAHSPGIVYVSINCYGHVGPWAERGGWEQLAQATTGIAHTESRDGVPAITPAAATDYTTGYLAAAGAMAALERQMTEGGSWLVEASLCQTAMWIQAAGAELDAGAATGFGNPPMTMVATPWGALTHLDPVEKLELTPARWEQPPVPLGSNDLRWKS